jgi:5S rRNA maturation endonuclease (ribonuclease M5)
VVVEIKNDQALLSKLFINFDFEIFGLIDINPNLKKIESLEI